MRLKYIVCGIGLFTGFGTVPCLLLFIAWAIADREAQPYHRRTLARKRANQKSYDKWVQEEAAYKRTIAHEEEQARIAEQARIEKETKDVKWRQSMDKLVEGIKTKGAG